MPEPIHLMIVHDNPLFRDCLTAVLAAEEGFVVDGALAAPSEAMTELAVRSPDVLLLALQLSENGSLALLHRISAEFPRVKTLILGLTRSGDIVRSIEAGGSGYVPQGASLDELKKAIRTLFAGGALCSPQIAGRVFSRLAEIAGEQVRLSAIESGVLTPRELEILDLVAQDLSNKEIAVRLGVSVYTVKNHVHNILEKLRVEDRRHAVACAYRNRWLADRRFGGEEPS